MAESFNLSSLKPSKGEHSISEVIFSVYLASPIINANRFEALVKDDGALKGEFQNFQCLTGLSLDMKIPSGAETDTAAASSIKKTGNDGFLINKFKDGNLTWVIGYQPSEPPVPGQDLLKIHCTNYDNWTNFFEEALRLLKIISGFESSLFISGYSLCYLDRFFWTEHELPEMQHIFKNDNLYLSNLFLTTKGIWNFNSNTNRPFENKMVQENINIGIRKNYTNEGKYSIDLIHNASTMIDEYKKLDEIIQEEELKKVANEMHTLNKTFLNHVFTEAVQNLIGLNKQKN